MHRQIDAGLSQLNRKLLTMAGHVERAIETATQAWRQRSQLKIKEVYAIEGIVNQAHIDVDASCVKLLALQQPLAADLRFIVAIIKINSDLERMVDLAVNIANNTEYYMKQPSSYPLDDLNFMADEVRVMVREVLDAFVRLDEKLARNVLRRDDAVDAKKRKIFTETQERMKTEPDTIPQGLNLILMAKNIERIGDHATNIAEDVIYMACGEDVRHHGSTVQPGLHGGT